MTSHSKQSAPNLDFPQVFKSMPREVRVLAENYIHRKECERIGFHDELPPEWIKIGVLLNYIEQLYFYKSFIHANEERHKAYLDHLKFLGLR